MQVSRPPQPPPPLRPGASSSGPGAAVATAHAPGLGAVSGVPGRGLGTSGYLLPTSTLIAFNQAQRVLGADQVVPLDDPAVEELMQATRAQVRTTRPRSRGAPSPLPPLANERRRHSAQSSVPAAGAAPASVPRRGAPKKKIDIGAMYERFDDVRHAEPNETAALKRLSLTDWLASYQEEMHSYSSVSIYAETKLSEAMRMDADRTPSAFRTAVCADLFYKVCGLFGRYSSLMQTIGDELCRSIYADFPTDSPPRGEDGAASPTAHFELTPYFNANKQMAERAEALQKLVEDLSDTTKFYERESRTRAKAIDVAQRPLRALLLQIYFKEWIKAVDRKQQRLMGIVLQWKDAKAQQMMVRCLFQGWKRMVKESLLDRVQSDYEAIKVSSTMESKTLREMLEKTSGRLEVAESIGDNRAAALTRILAQFQRPGAVEAMKRRRRESIVQLSADIGSVGLLDRDLRATFDGIIEFIDQDASAKQSADAAADEARRLTEEAHAASAAQAAENDAMRAAEEAERQRILAEPKKRAVVGRDDIYVVRRIEALSWSAEALIVGPMGPQRIKQPPPTSGAYVPPQPPILTPLLREYETTEEVLLDLPVPALLERWLTFQLRQAKVFSLAERVETSGTADTAVLGALISRIDPTGYSWREQDAPTRLTPPSYEPGKLTAKDLGDDGADEDEDEVAAAFNTQLDAGGQEEENKAAAVMGAVRLLLCEGYSTVAVQEDLVGAATKAPEAAAASAAAVGQMIAQLFLEHPSLPTPEEVGTASLRTRLDDVQKNWGAFQTQGWKNDDELVGILEEYASLVEEGSELQTKQQEAAALWPLIVQRVREYATAAVATITSSDTGAGKALLALRPGLEGSEAAAAAASTGEATVGDEIVIGGTAGSQGGYAKMRSNQLGELLPKGVSASEQVAEIKAAQRVLLENERNLWQIYREYCADDGVLDGQVAEDGLTSSDFARFIKDVRFPRSMLHTQLLKPLLDRAKFDNSFGAWEPDTFDPDPDQEDPDAERGWSFSEFSEALCRLAATAYPTSDAVPVPAAKERSSGVSTWLSAALKQLLNDHILPRVPASAGVAVAVSVGEEDFRRRVGSSAVRAVHKKFEGTLRKLFRHYAKAGQRGEMVVMSLFQLVEFCQDMGLSPSEDNAEAAQGHNLQIHDVRKMFAAAVAAVDVGEVKAAEEADKGSMVFYDFLECLAAFAGCCYTDPYLPLEAKLGQLLAREVLPNAKRLGTV